MEPNAVRIVKDLQVLNGWHTIAFQVDAGRNLGDAMMQAATDALLKRSDNYYVRIDEVQGSLWYPRTTVGNRSTLVINGNVLDAVERRIHEDVCPCTRCTPLQCCDHITPRGRNWGVEDDTNF
jgi:hypothetical protein